MSAVFLLGVNANISLPEIFSDNMVLQQKSEVLFWGWAKTGEPVTIKADWMDWEVKVSVGNQGTWKVMLKTPGAGGPHNILIKGYNELILKNVLIGEVWLCSGQSNMEWSAQSGINNGEEEIKNANYPEIRLFTVYHATSLYPQDHLTGEWSECTSETMRSFSAIAYLFAKKLFNELRVPIGLINSSWGGTPAEAWMPAEVIGNDNFLKEAAAKQKPVPWGPVEPGRIFNSMISPLIPYRIAGGLWYQGEANTINAYAYKEMLSGLIGSWRTKWGYDFPFYYAQIAPYRYGNAYEGVMVREAQRKALEVPNTGMVVLSDIGDTLNIHPRNKTDVALRLANLALNRHYKVLQIEDSGPLFKQMIIEKNRAIISFDRSEGLHFAGDKLTCFEIAGDDKIFYPGEAKIKGEQVFVTSKKVKLPVAVRFAWSNTATPNLFNGSNLPASCFTTE
ncbi:MAG TPA: sialate O-acetylesterase [Bacteroidales bacterium]|nr:sialate O-acetylesterase [Bacteroidales bacterium]